MSRIIIKLTDEATKSDYYLEYSTIVDAPVTYGMSIEEFKTYYIAEYGKVSIRELNERLERVQRTGHSSLLDKTIEQVICLGKRSKNDILVEFCIKKPGVNTPGFTKTNC